MIIWNFLFVVSYFSTSSGILEWREDYVIEYTSILPAFLFVGLAADCWIGRYRILRTAMYLLLVGVIINTTDEVVIPSSIPALPYVAIAFQTLSGVCYGACTIQFTMDQLVGASGEELSFSIFWLVWGYIAGALVAIGIESQLFLNDMENNLLFSVVSSLSLVAAICMTECCSHWLMTKPQLSNPIKHIAKVLNYARKHKYPERRSALTYWEDDYPSRIDLGKDKYGGPFTVEEVEDVKTILRLIPIIICATAFVVPLWSKWGLITSENGSTWYNPNELHTCLTISGLISSLGLPIYHTIIYPLFYNYIPSMLKRIGLGYLLLLLSLLSSSYFVLVQSTDLTNFTCTQVNGALQDADNGPWEIGPNILFSSGIVIFLYAFFEFLTAQSPQQVKGAIMCLMYGCFGCFTLAGLGLNKLLQSFTSTIQVTPGCMFYHYSIYTIMTAALLVLFVVVSWRYKLRKRDDVIPYHMFAEKYFEKNYKQRRVLQRNFISQKRTGHLSNVVMLLKAKIYRQ